MTDALTAHSSTLPALRVLVVDDNRTNLQILQAFLGKLGHRVLPAENGERAVALAAAHKPDLILLDILMPVMDGFEAARRIRAQTFDRWIPIIFLSALDRDENLVAGLEAGGDDFMSKPINFVVLEAKMRSMQRMVLLQRQAIESLKRIEAISDNAMDAIVTIDSQARVVACNAACERIFGWSQADLLGRNVNVLMPEPFHSEHDDYVRNYVQGGAPRVIGFGREAPALHRDGRTIPVELGITEVRYDQQRLFIGVIRDISERKLAERKLRENAELLQRYYEETESEVQLARSLIDKQLLRPSLNDAQLHYWLMPAQHFSGDVVAAARAPDGRLYALLADATGHGLTAAISTLPVLTIFYSMVEDGAKLTAIISEINRLLRQSMPVGRFVAAALVCVDHRNEWGEIWVGGTPEALLIDPEGKILRRFPSSQLPLGIVDSDASLAETTAFPCTGGCQLLIHSDGLLEACDTADRAFGNDALCNALLGSAPSLRHESLRSALLQHLDGAPAHDDVSILLLDCGHNEPASSSDRFTPA